MTWRFYAVGGRVCKVTKTRSAKSVWVSLLFTTFFLKKSKTLRSFSGIRRCSAPRTKVIPPLSLK